MGVGLLLASLGAPKAIQGLSEASQDFPMPLQVSPQVWEVGRPLESLFSHFFACLKPIFRIFYCKNTGFFAFFAFFAFFQTLHGGWAFSWPPWGSQSNTEPFCSLLGLPEISLGLPKCLGVGWLIECYTIIWLYAWKRVYKTYKNTAGGYLPAPKKSISPSSSPAEKRKSLAESKKSGKKVVDWGDLWVKDEKKRRRDSKWSTFLLSNHSFVFVWCIHSPHDYSNLAVFVFVVGM